MRGLTTIMDSVGWGGGGGGGGGGVFFFFFFSSRRRHTRLVSDWSSDVCSSDLVEEDRDGGQLEIVVANDVASDDDDEPQEFSEVVEVQASDNGEDLGSDNSNLELDDEDLDEIGRASCRERV